MVPWDEFWQIASLCALVEAYNNLRIPYWGTKFGEIREFKQITTAGATTATVT